MNTPTTITLRCATGYRYERASYQVDVVARTVMLVAKGCRPSPVTGGSADALLRTAERKLGFVRVWNEITQAVDIVRV